MNVRSREVVGGATAALVVLLLLLFSAVSPTSPASDVKQQVTKALDHQVVEHTPKQVITTAVGHEEVRTDAGDASGAVLRTQPPDDGQPRRPSDVVASDLCQHGGSRQTTAGRYGDEHNTGNEEIDKAADLAALSPVANWTAFFSAPRAVADGSVLQRADVAKNTMHCYYRARNVCVKDGALLFLRPRAKRSGKESGELWPGTQATATSKFGVLRLCNELRPKVHLKFFIADRPPDGATWVTASDGAAHVTACWQYYGYHLMQCLAAAFAVESQHGFVGPLDLAHRRVDLWLYNHAVSLPQISRDHFSHAMYMGGAGSWNDTAPRRKSHRAAPWWGLWAQSTSSPFAVDELFKFPVGPDLTGPDRCYDRALIGQPNHHAVGGPARRAHQQHLDALITLRRPIEPAPHRPFRIVVGQRGGGTKNQGGRRILNLDAVLEGLRGLRPADDEGSKKAAYHTAVVQAVDFAALALAEQYRAAASADILIAMHGGGNSWIAAMRPRTVFIEVWPQCIARNVYLVMARQYNIRYYSLCLNLPVAAPPGSPEARYGFLHHSLSIPVDKLAQVVRQAFDYLAAVRAAC